MLNAVKDSYKCLQGSVKCWRHKSFLSNIAFNVFQKLECWTVGTENILRIILLGSYRIINLKQMSSVYQLNKYWNIYRILIAEASKYRHFGIKFKITISKVESFPTLSQTFLTDRQNVLTDILLNFPDLKLN